MIRETELFLWREVGNRRKEIPVFGPNSDQRQIFFDETGMTAVVGLVGKWESVLVTNHDWKTRDKKYRLFPDLVRGSPSKKTASNLSEETLK
ncbi:MAG: hypothetical protein AAGA85_14840 [Bacteroidota bacterium]